MAEEKVVKLLNADAGMERQENRITEELHKVVRGEEAALEHDVFFAEGFRAYTDIAGRSESLLTYGDDYEFCEPDSIAAEISGRDCYRKIVVHADIDKCYVDYHAYGDFIRAEELNGAKTVLTEVKKTAEEGAKQIFALKGDMETLRETLGAHIADTKPHGSSAESKENSLALRTGTGALKAAPAEAGDEAVIKSQLESRMKELKTELEKQKAEAGNDLLPRVQTVSEALTKDEAAGALKVIDAEKAKEYEKEKSGLEAAQKKKKEEAEKEADEEKRKAALKKLEEEAAAEKKAFEEKWQKSARGEAAARKEPFHLVLRNSRGSIVAPPAESADEVVIKSQLEKLSAGGVGAAEMEEFKKSVKEDLQKLKAKDSAIESNYNSLSEKVGALGSGGGGTEKPREIYEETPPAGRNYVFWEGSPFELPGWINFNPRRSLMRQNKMYRQYLYVKNLLSYTMRAEVRVGKYYEVNSVMSISGTVKYYQSGYTHFRILDSTWPSGNAHIEGVGGGEQKLIITSDIYEMEFWVTVDYFLDPAPPKH